MRARLTPIGELTSSDRAAWAELAERAAEPNPFLHPDFVLPAASALRPRGLRVLHAEDEGGWLACLPVVPVLGRRDVPGPGLASWRHDYCYLGTPLLAPGRVGDGARGLLAGARRGLYLALDWVGDGVLDGALGVEPVAGERFERGFARRGSGPRVGSSSARRLRRNRRRLAETLGDEPAAVEDPGLADAFLALEASGWKGRAGTAMAARSGHAGFFRAVCDSFARRDALQFLSLEAGGRRAAMQCNLRAGDGLVNFKVAYDETLSPHAPGIQLEVLALERLAGDERAAWFDSCAAPDDEVINRIWPQRRALGTLVVPTRAGFASVVRPGAAAMEGARRLRRRALELRAR